MLSLIILLSISQKTHGQNTTNITAQGCSYDSRLDAWSCNFDQWIPPLKDEEFDPGPLQHLSLTNINGEIPGGAFSGLNGPTAKNNAYIFLRCTASNIILSRDVFTENLKWVMELRIYDCYLKSGLSSRLLENLKGLELFLINGRAIEGFVAHDALAGLTGLQSLFFQAPVVTGKLPPCLLDGLKNLTKLRLMSTELNVIPPNWFNGLLNLEEISIADNRLQELPSGLFDELRSLMNVQLHANPWNCSCELMWLLDWSNVTNQVLCKDPPHFEGLKLEDAFAMLDCASTTPVPSATQTPDMEAPSCTTFSGTTVARLATSSQKTYITSTSAPIETSEIILISTASPIIPSSTSTTMTTGISSVLVKLKTMSILKASTITSATFTEIWSEKTMLSLISKFNVSTDSTISPTSYSTSTITRGPDNQNKENNSGYDATKIRSAALLSSVGALPLMLAGSAVVYRSVCRKNAIGNVNSVSSGGEGR